MWKSHFFGHWFTKMYKAWLKIEVVNKVRVIGMDQECLGICLVGNDEGCLTTSISNNMHGVMLSNSEKGVWNEEKNLESWQICQVFANIIRSNVFCASFWVWVYLYDLYTQQILHNVLRQKHVIRWWYCILYLHHTRTHRKANVTSRVGVVSYQPVRGDTLLMFHSGRFALTNLFTMLLGSIFRVSFFP